MEAERDYLGFIDLDKLHIKNKKVINVFNSFSFIFNGKRYFFKELKNTNQCYNELIGYELARDFGLLAVPYDLASYDGFCGYISENYLRDGYVYLEDILKKYYSNTRYKNNLNDAVIAISNVYSEEFANNIRFDLIKLLMFDIIIGNYDRHDKNIIIDEKHARLGVVPDNEMMLSSDAMYNQYYGFKMFDGDRNTLDNLLSYLDEDGLRFFMSKIQIISNENIESVMKRVETKIGRPMIAPLKQELNKKFGDYYRYLVRVVQKELDSRLILRKKQQ